MATVAVLAAIGLGLTTPAANAAPGTPLESDLGSVWTKVFTTPASQNPFGTGAASTACWDLGGTVAPFGPNSVPSCTVKPGTHVFVMASSAECSTFAADSCGGPNASAAELKKDALSADQAIAGTPPTITADGANVAVSEVYSSVLNITLPANNVLGAPAGTTGRSVAHGWVALLHPLTPGNHVISVKSTKLSYHTTIIVQPKG